MKVYLETPRLILREFTELDIDNLVDLDSDPKVTLYINGGKPTPRDYVEEQVMPR
ncbi:MAG: N-acetyltransferase, partial [Candidatus Marinimicrobia bacterium]|nr:N-acetyltransferase [Candidatus Neomarinimicrobiota bacterium]